MNTFDFGSKEMKNRQNFLVNFFSLQPGFDPQSRPQILFFFWGVFFSFLV